jgi:hypothetical protein
MICDTEFNCIPRNLHDLLPKQNENIRTTTARITMWKRKTLHRRHACDLETPDVDKIPSNAWLKPGKIFRETTEFMVAIPDPVISSSAYSFRFVS